MPKGASAHLEWLDRIARSVHYQGLHSQDVLRTALSMTCSAIDVAHACILTFDEHGELLALPLLHLVVPRQDVRRQVLAEARRLLHDRYDLEHVTIQIDDLTGEECIDC